MAKFRFVLDHRRVSAEAWDRWCNGENTHKQDRIVSLGMHGSYADQETVEVSGKTAETAKKYLLSKMPSDARIEES